MSVELEYLLTKGNNPCEGGDNVYLSQIIHCPGDTTNCSKCIWEKKSDVHPKLLNLIDILDIEPDG